ncbi:hypothetical protein LCL95_09525 [Bacillus timonensis]|nr:hypothetical protein [Bacillus timonensis]
MADKVKRKKHAGDNNHKMSKDLLKEEFGTELGDQNASKAYELLANRKGSKKQK